MKQIALPDGLFTIVDDEDFELYGHLPWKLSSARPDYPALRYVRCTLDMRPGRKTLFLHKLIAGTLRHQHTRHLNRDRLDNRRENLAAAASRFLAEAEWDAICARHQLGERTKALATEYCVEMAEIARQLQKRGVIIPPASVRNRRYQFNETFFSNVETEAQAYWLGFIGADGGIKRNSLRIGLARRDRDHLIAFSQAIGCDYAIKDFMGGLGKKWPSSVLDVHSPRLVRDLASYGVVQRKGPILPWPALPIPLLRHYLRGYVDGDGCFYHRKNAWEFLVVTSPVFGPACQAYLMSQCDLRQTSLCVPYPHAPIIHLRYSGRLQVQRIFRLLYEGCQIALPRKRKFGIDAGWLAPDCSDVWIDNAAREI